MNDRNQTADEDVLTPSDESASIPFQRIKNQQLNTTRPVSNGGASRASLGWRRRNTLVNPEYQLRFTGVLLLQMTSVLIAIAGFALLQSQKNMALVLRHVSDSPLYSHYLHGANQSLLFKLLVVIGFAGMVQILFGIYMSHKLAGPIVQMTRVLAEVGDGNYDARVSFRKDDHLEDLGRSLNQLFEALASERSATIRNVTEIERLLAEIRNSQPASDESLAQFRLRLTSLAGIDPISRPTTELEEVHHG